MDIERRLEVVEAENEMLRERVRQLEAELSGGADFVAPFEWGLTFSEAQVLGIFVARELVTKHAIMQALYSSIGREGVEEKICDVFICKIRKKLKPYGVGITTRWGQGWSLDPVWRARLADKEQRQAA